MNPDTIDGGDEIDKIVRNVLKGSKAWGKFPTPVDQIVSYAELQVANGVDLSKVEQGFFTKQLHVLQRAVSKVLAAIDLREKQSTSISHKNRNVNDSINCTKPGTKL